MPLAATSLANRVSACAVVSLAPLKSKTLKFSAIKVCRRVVLRPVSRASAKLKRTVAGLARCKLLLSKAKACARLKDVMAGPNVRLSMWAAWMLAALART